MLGDDADSRLDGFGHVSARKSDVVNPESSLSTILLGEFLDFLVQIQEREIHESGTRWSTLRNPMLKGGKPRQDRSDPLGSSEQTTVEAKYSPMVCPREAAPQIQA